MNLWRSALLQSIKRTTFVTQVRQITEEPWKRKYLRRYGYNDPFFKRPDTLPRLKDDKSFIDRLPEYRPEQKFSEKAALFGQNDYIDILGDGSIHPVKLMTEVPHYLRGFQGNEFQMLIKKKQKYYYWKWTKPTKWKWMNKRFMHLYRYLNRKTKT